MANYASTVGFIAGSMIGGPIGGAIGSAVAVAFFGPVTRTEGPRLGDLSATASSYGNAIPRLYGTHRFAGDMLYCGEIEEASQVVKIDSANEVVNYTYFSTFALSLCEGQISAVLKVFADGKLIYDATETDPARKQAGDDACGAYMIVHDGSDDQPADITLQGLDPNTSAYRGTAYVVFKRFPLAEYGNKIPNLEFVVSKADARLTSPSPIGVLGGYIPSLLPGAANHPSMSCNATDLLDVSYFVAGFNGGSECNSQFSYQQYNTTPSGSMGSIGVNIIINTPPPVPIPFTDDFLITAGNLWNVRFTGEVKGFAYRYTDNGLGGTGTKQYVNIYDRKNNNVFQLDFDNPASPGGITLTSSIATVSSPNKAAALVAVSYITSSGQAGLTIKNFSVDIISGGKTALSTSEMVFSLGAGEIHDLVAAGSHVYAVIGSGNTWALKIFDSAGALVNSIVLATTDPNKFRFDHFGTVLAVRGGTVYVASILNAYVALYSLDPLIDTELTRINTLDIANTLPAGTTIRTAGPSAPADYWPHKYLKSAYCNAGLFVLGAMIRESGDYPVDASLPLVFGSTGSYEAGKTSDAAIIDAECAVAGMPASIIDTSKLGTVVDGYLISSRANPRDNLTPLASYTFFDSIEVDHKLTFVPRGQSALTLIPESDLGAAEEGGKLADAITWTRTHESELPSEIAVAFADPAGDYAVGSQYQRRMTSSSNMKSDVQLPIAMSQTQAAATAARLLYMSYAGRNKAAFSTTLKYAHLMPSDVVALTQGDKAYRVRITKREDTPTGVLKFEAESDDGLYLTQSPDADDVTQATQRMNATGVTEAIMLDLVALEDYVINRTTYYGLASSVPSWPGGGLYSRGTTDELIKETKLKATVGRTNHALGAPTQRSSIRDDINELLVTIENGGVLVSTDYATLKRGVANRAAIGQEVIQFQSATLISSVEGNSVYRLQGLMRGCRGSDYYCDKHVTGERFVLLDSNILSFKTLNPSGSDTTKGLGAITSPVSTQYKAVTRGRPSDSGNYQDFTPTNLGTRPLSPVAGFVGITIPGEMSRVYCKARSRDGMPWVDYADVPQSDISFGYYTSSASIRMQTEHVLFLYNPAGELVPGSDISGAIARYASPDLSSIYFDVPLSLYTPGTGYKAKIANIMATSHYTTMRQADDAVDVLWVDL